MLKKILLILVIVGILALGYVWFFVYNKQHKDIKGAKADFELSHAQLVAEAQTNAASLQTIITKYDQKVLEISGRVSSIEPNDSISTVVFGTDSDKFNVNIEVLKEFNEKAKGLHQGDSVKMKALFIGITSPDEMMEIPGYITLKKSTLEIIK